MPSASNSMMYNSPVSMSLPQYDYLGFDLGPGNDSLSRPNDTRVPVPSRDRNGSPSSPTLSDTDTFAGSGGASPAPSSVYSPPWPYTAVITPSSLDTPLPISPAIAGSYTEIPEAWLRDVEENPAAPALMPPASSINFDEWYTPSVQPTADKVREDVYATIRLHSRDSTVGTHAFPTVGDLSALYTPAPSLSQGSPPSVYSPTNRLPYPDTSTWPSTADLNARTYNMSTGNSSPAFDPADITSSFNPFSLPEFTFTAPVTSEVPQHPAMGQPHFNQATQSATQLSSYYNSLQSIQQISALPKLSTSISPEATTSPYSVSANYTQAPNQMSIAPALIDPSDAAVPSYGEWNQGVMEGIGELVSALNENAVDSEEDEEDVEDEVDNDDDEEWRPSPRSLNQPVLHSSLPTTHGLSGSTASSKNRRTVSFSGTNDLTGMMITNDGSHTIRARPRRVAPHGFGLSTALVSSSGLGTGISTSAPPTTRTSGWDAINPMGNSTPASASGAGSSNTVPVLTKRSRGRQVPTVRLSPEIPGAENVSDDADKDREVSGTRRSRRRPSSSLSSSRRLSSGNGVAGMEDTAGRTRSYVCRVNGCGKCFQRGEHLKRHMRSIHTNEKPFKCPHPGCGKDFSRRDNLFQHTSIHAKYAAK